MQSKQLRGASARLFVGAQDAPSAAVHAARLCIVPGAVPRAAQAAHHAGQLAEQARALSLRILPTHVWASACPMEHCMM